MPQQPAERLVGRFFRDVVAALDRPTGNPRSVIPPDPQHITVDRAGMALCSPKDEQWAAYLMTGLPVGFVHLEVAGRASAIIFAGAADRLPGKTADILGKGLGVEEAEPNAGFR